MPREIVDEAREVWCPTEDECWSRAEVTVMDGDKLTVFLPATGEVREVPASAVCEVDETHLQNLPNVTDMNNLHEAPLLHLLRRRLEDQIIYTWAGAVLISVNPYSQLEIYGAEHLAKQKAAADGGGDDVPPHIYAVARHAHLSLLGTAEGETGDGVGAAAAAGHARNHSIVISGESGAGKTEASKRVIEYLTFASQRKRNRSPSSTRARGGSQAEDYDDLLLSPRRTESLRRGGSKANTPGASPSKYDSPNISAAQSFPAGRRRCQTTPAGSASAASAAAAGLSPERNPPTVRKSVSGANFSFQSTWLEEATVEEHVSMSVPALEAFGNAKTIRNNNSSRFGKFIRIHYGDDGCITSATTQHYLLERSRLVEISRRERNFHIFYMLTAASAAGHALAAPLQLGADASYHYLVRDGGDPKVEGRDDLDEFETVATALQSLGVRRDVEQPQLYRIVAALMSLGNVSFVEDGDGCGVTAGAAAAALARAAELLGVDSPRLDGALRKRTIKAGAQDIETPLSPTAAGFARDSLTKVVYSSLFDWLVDAINEKAAGEFLNSTSKFIGVLDIFGFEILQVNSFEQLCINYVNEMLQEHFNEMVFESEQRLIQTEGLGDFAIKFADSGPRLRLLSAVFARLDDQAKKKKADDGAFLGNVAEVVKGNQREWGAYCAVDDRDGLFTISHYAGKVAYAVDGFTAKNDDNFSSSDLLSLVAHCDGLEFLRAQLPGGGGEGGGDGDGKKKGGGWFGKKLEAAASLTKHASSTTGAKVAGPGTVSGKMRLGIGLCSKLMEKGDKAALARSGGSVKEAGLGGKEPLMDLLTDTAPHYVRCIKPNEHKAAFGFAHSQVLTQCRYLGLLEVVRIRQEGLPVRMPYAKFAARYENLYQYASAFGTGAATTAAAAALQPKSPRKASAAASHMATVAAAQAKVKLILQAGDLNLEGENADAALGRTLVFLRNLMLPRLDAKQRRVASAAAGLQRVHRGRAPRLAFSRLKRAARRVASAQRRRVWRALISAMQRRFRRRVAALRVVASAILVRIVMTSPQVTALLRRRSAAALTIQSGARGMAARTQRRWLALEKLQRHMILKLQRNWRVYLIFRFIRGNRYSTIRLQRAARGRLARAKYGSARAAALVIATWIRGWIARRRLAKAKRAATTVQRRARGNAARKQTAARWAALRYVQRWTHGNHARLVVRGLFAAARAGEKGRVEGALKKHPELLLVRAPERGSRQTIVHAVAEGGSVALLQEVVKKVAEATLGRIASLHEATVLCLQDPRLLDVRRASPLHAAAAAGQLDSVQWLLAKAQNQSFDGRSYTDLPVLKELLGLADADGRTPLHAALYAAGAADASVERRARLACWLLQHAAAGGEPIELPPASSAAAAAALPHLGDDGLAEISSMSDGNSSPELSEVSMGGGSLIDGVLKASRRAAAAAAPPPPSLPVVAVLKQAIGATSAEAAARCRERLHDATPRLQSAASVANAYDEQQLEEASMGHARPPADISQTLVAASTTLQNQYELAGHLRSLHRLAEVERAPLRRGGTCVLVWLENINLEDAGVRDERGGGAKPSHHYATLQMVHEREGQGWMGSASFASTFNRDGQPFRPGRDAAHPWEEPSAPPALTAAESAHFWHLWSTPLLPSNWDEGVLLLRLYALSDRDLKKKEVGWTAIKLSDLKYASARRDDFHLQLRAPPVASRLRELGKQKHVPIWVHGSVALAINGVTSGPTPSASALARAASDALGGRRLSRSNSGRPLELTHRVSGSPTSEHGDRSRSPSHVHMSAREVKEALARATNVHVPPVEAKARAFKALMAAGRAANSAEDFAGALEAFEAAFGLQPDAVPLLSAANMRLKLGEAAVAKEIYRWLLTQTKFELPPHAEEMAIRKLRSLPETPRLVNRATTRHAAVPPPSPGGDTPVTPPALPIPFAESAARHLAAPPAAALPEASPPPPPAYPGGDGPAASPAAAAPSSLPQPPPAYPGGDGPAADSPTRERGSSIAASQRFSGDL